jgi:DNA replication initiation complex subunit (GINS family)
LESEGKEINITYETLFELLRREKTREELQKLDNSFFEDVVNYLKDKKAVLDKPKDDLFAAEERRKADIQFENIKKILKEFYERREKKIMNMAMDMSRMSMGALNSEIVDTSAMLKEEKELFDCLVEILNNNRKGILYNVLEAMIPKVEKKETKDEAQKDEPSGPQKSLISETKEEVKTSTEVSNESQAETQKMVRFLQAVPKFVGKDLEEYGPFEQGDTTNLPSEIADVLIAKQKAELMKKE